jgi:hypothetical protein
MVRARHTPHRALERGRGRRSTWGGALLERVEEASLELLLQVGQRRLQRVSLLCQLPPAPISSIRSLCTLYSLCTSKKAGGHRHVLTKSSAE